MNDAPSGSALDRNRLSGRAFLEARIAGRGAAPLGELLGLILVEVGDGFAVFEATPKPEHYNPAGVVHGGWMASILDSALGCAIHSRLGPGVGYGTIELKVNFVRAMTEKTGLVRCRGDVVHMGRRLATSEGRLVDGSGRLYAHGSCTCMIYE